MKASINLEYRDGSEVWFDFDCSDSDSTALAVLMMVCRGVLMVSLANRVIAYDEEGFDICSYVK